MFGVIAVSVVAVWIIVAIIVLIKIEIVVRIGFRWLVFVSIAIFFIKLRSIFDYISVILNLYLLLMMVVSQLLRSSSYFPN